MKTILTIITLSLLLTTPALAASLGTVIFGYEKPSMPNTIGELI